MRFFNSDGSEGDLCGNGLRCFYKYVIDQKLTPKASEEYVMSPCPIWDENRG